MAEIPDVPVELVMPSATTGDDTDEEVLGVAEEISYEGLTETDEAIVDAPMQTFLVDMPLADLSGPPTVDVTPGTETQDQSDAPGIEAPTDGVTM
ncbi:hypothetical protein H5410_060887 [Solanum commersonii]|uniref:Polyprotein protein n=1 Tax=Solanum commersonii TaxID=4109 RepID=A0A9J5W6N5_SOLCO|nr:hypothetical protein H5410_060887 [Solanum commersonii]